MTSATNADQQQLDQWKQDAAAKAVEYVRSDSVIGLGTGSTSAHFLRLLGERLQDGRLHDVSGVPTSEGAARLAQEAGIPLTSLDEHPVLELTVDGADEVEPGLDVIKGGGGALLREKIVAQATQRLVIIVDASKLSDKLGTVWPVPIEVIPFGCTTQWAFLEDLGAEVTLRRTASGEALYTDQGNLILDCRFGPIDDPRALARTLDKRAGIVEHGLFLGMVGELVVAGPDGVRHLYRNS